MKKHEDMTRAELLKCIKVLEQRAPMACVAFEHERLLHELQVHQTELETQNRELRDAQLLLERSRDRYADLYDFAPVGYVTFNDKGVIQEINLTAAGMLGVERTRLVGALFHLHVAREDLARFREHLAKLEHLKERVVTEVQLIRKGDSPLPVVMQSVLFYDEESKTHLCRTALTDIAARKQAEQLVHESAELNRGILGSLSAHIAVLDTSGNIIAVNEAWTRFEESNGGSSLAHAGLGSNYLDACRRATALSEAEARPVLEGIEAVLQGARPSFSTEYACHSPRERRWFSLSVTPSTGQHGGAVVSHLNITERKKAEEALREANEFGKQVIAGAEAGIIVYDREGRIVVWNPFMEQLTGYRMKEVLGRPALEAFPFLHEPHFGKMFKRALAGEVFEAADISFNLPEKGKRGWTVARFAPWRDARQAVVGVIVAVRDITERRRLESELLEISDRERQRIGHDLHDGLGQQLTALEMKSFLLLENLAGKDLVARRRQVQEQARQISEALCDCVTVTRSLAHGLAPLKLNADGLLGVLKQLAQNSRVPGRIECRFVARAPVVPDDSQTVGHLYRIAQEAVGNALRHSQARHIQIRLAHDKGALRLQIRDDGRGLTKSKKNSSGMGLEVMRHRAHVIGAALEIESKPGQGTNITCTLPLGKS